VIALHEITTCMTSLLIACCDWALECGIRVILC